MAQYSEKDFVSELPIFLHKIVGCKPFFFFFPQLILVTMTDFNGFKLKKSRLDKEEIIFCEDGKELVEFAQRSSGCPVAGSVSG